MYTLKIKVKKGNIEIEYSQDSNDNSGLAGVCKDGYSSLNTPSQLYKTVKELCNRVKELSDDF